MSRSGIFISPSPRIATSFSALVSCSALVMLGNTLLEFSNLYASAKYVWSLFNLAWPGENCGIWKRSFCVPVDCSTPKLIFDVVATTTSAGLAILKLVLPFGLMSGTLCPSSTGFTSPVSANCFTTDHDPSFGNKSEPRAAVAKMCLPLPSRAGFTSTRPMRILCLEKGKRKNKKKSDTHPHHHNVYIYIRV